MTDSAREGIEAPLGETVELKVEEERIVDAVVVRKHPSGHRVHLLSDNGEQVFTGESLKHRAYARMLANAVARQLGGVEVRDETAS